jgi:hypothetical protein
MTGSNIPSMLDFNTTISVEGGNDSPYMWVGKVHGDKDRVGIVLASCPTILISLDQRVIGGLISALTQVQENHI